ncbi:hypothetical protein QVD17_02052 [Tagetes erecta]|uniref:Uncharacterized protein n=1 Tax=Tagetes erecta TaxID=13708 RepID=A0AAD8L8G2_TARER|nr:hypothetical protein QVD17_02052 [Tagetes erecta]
MVLVVIFKRKAVVFSLSAFNLFIAAENWIRRQLVENLTPLPGSLSAKRLPLRRNNASGSHSVRSLTSTSIASDDVSMFLAVYYDLGERVNACEFHQNQL